MFEARLHKHYDELKWLYCELYQQQPNPLNYFDDLIKNLKDFYDQREAYLKELDIAREKNTNWYKGNDFIGMMMYVNNFSGTLKGFEKRIPYLQESNVNYIHLMPLLTSPKDEGDGGYAVADFRNVQEELGTMEDLRKLAKKCHRNKISICLDFVMNHTSNQHEWAKKQELVNKNIKIDISSLIIMICQDYLKKNVHRYSLQQHQAISLI